MNRQDLVESYIRKLSSQRERPTAPSTESAGVTSLLGCLRKSWFRRHNLLEWDQESLSTHLAVLIGSFHHNDIFTPRWEKVRSDIYVRYYPDNDAAIATTFEERNSELLKEIAGGEGPAITGFVDWVEEDGGVALASELKGTRSDPRYGISTSYIQQIMAYMAIMKMDKGRIYIVHLIGAGTRKDHAPTVKIYEVRTNETERNTWKAELARRLHLLLAEELPGLAEHEPWECVQCPARHTLDAMGKVLCTGGGGRLADNIWWGVESKPNHIHDFISGDSDDGTASSTNQDQPTEVSLTIQGGESSSQESSGEAGQADSGEVGKGQGDTTSIEQTTDESRTMDKGGEG